MFHLVLLQAASCWCLGVCLPVFDGLGGRSISFKGCRRWNSCRRNRLEVNGWLTWHNHVSSHSWCSKFGRHHTAIESSIRDLISVSESVHVWFSLSVSLCVSVPLSVYTHVWEGCKHGRGERERGEVWARERGGKCVAMNKLLNMFIEFMCHPHHCADVDLENRLRNIAGHTTLLDFPEHPEVKKKCCATDVILNHKEVITQRGSPNNSWVHRGSKIDSVVNKMWMFQCTLLSVFLCTLVSCCPSLYCHVFVYLIIMFSCTLLSFFHVPYCHVFLPVFLLVNHHHCMFITQLDVLDRLGQKA